MLKKVLGVLIVVGLVFSFTGCGNGEEAADPDFLEAERVVSEFNEAFNTIDYRDISEDEFRVPKELMTKELHQEMTDLYPDHQVTFIKEKEIIAEYIETNIVSMERDEAGEDLIFVVAEIESETISQGVITDRMSYSLLEEDGAWKVDYAVYEEQP